MRRVRLRIQRNNRYFELSHALDRADRQDDDPQLDAAAEELIAETTAYSVCASSGIDPGEYAISYLAG